MTDRCRLGSFGKFEFYRKIVSNRSVAVMQASWWHSQCGVTDSQVVHIYGVIIERYCIGSVTHVYLTSDKVLCNGTRRFEYIPLEVHERSANYVSCIGAPGGRECKQKLDDVLPNSTQYIRSDEAVRFASHPIFNNSIIYSGLVFKASSKQLYLDCIALRTIKACCSFSPTSTAQKYRRCTEVMRRGSLLCSMTYRSFYKANSASEFFFAGALGNLRLEASAKKQIPLLSAA